MIETKPLTGERTEEGFFRITGGLDEISLEEKHTVSMLIYYGVKRQT